MAVLLSFAPRTHAQWITQNIPLKGGWNAVFLHVDASYGTVQELVGNDVSNPIDEIWMWNPAPNTLQFITTPQAPADSGSQWVNWSASLGLASPLTRLLPNVAYLVHIPNATASYMWNLKGKPVAPRYQWTSSGLNFLGFSVVPATPPPWENFLALAPDLQQNGEIFFYPGGDLGPSNPQQLFAFRTQRVNRGEAYWIRSPNFNRYFGPFEVTFTGSGGARFGSALGQISFRLRNNSSQDIIVTLAGVVSEEAPAGQPAIQGPVPVLVRGDIDPATLTFTHTALSTAPKQWTLKKSGEVGSELEVVLGVDRQQVTGTPGQLYGSILRFTDSLGYSQVEVATSAEVGSPAGLWVGSASVTSVNHYLNTYAKVTNSTDLTALLTRLGLAEGVDGYHYEIDPPTKRVLVFGGPKGNTGSYLLDGPAKVDPGAVARPFPLRLIIHNDGTAARLLQRAYYGVGLATNPVVATKESLLLPTQLESARRLSAIHLPTSAANAPWALTGAMQAGSSLTTTFEVSFDDQASNPFLHTYHPDHDNLDAPFRLPQSRGLESYGVRRQITLTFTPPATDFNSLTRGTATLNGNYGEVITFLGKPGAERQFTVRGVFTLNRISDIATLTTQ